MNDRRRFLQVFGTAAAALSLGCMGCGNAGQSNSTRQQSGLLNGGPAANVALGSLNLLPNASAAIGRDAGGLYALSTICTLTGCDMADSGSVGTDGLSCGCHGSEFSVTGDVVRGPANRALNHLAVTIGSDGTYTVNFDQVVSADQRTPVSV